MNFALRELNILKRKHSKSDYLSGNSLKIAPYLNDEKFSKKEAQILFSLRSRTMNLKMNFGSQNLDNLCEICKLFPETQSHLLQCPEIAPKLNLISLDTKLDESFVYGSVENQLKISRIYCKIMDMRKQMLKERNEN